MSKDEGNTFIVLSHSPTESIYEMDFFSLGTPPVKRCTSCTETSDLVRWLDGVIAHMDEQQGGTFDTQGSETIPPDVTASSGLVSVCLQLETSVPERAAPLGLLVLNRRWSIQAAISR